jgi:DNA-directed RNA polymerase subunit K/omega
MNELRDKKRGLEFPDLNQPENVDVDNEKFTKAVEQARNEILARKANERQNPQSAGQAEGASQVIPKGLGGSSPEFQAELNSDPAGGSQKEILARALEILQGDKRIIENKGNQPSGSAHALTEAVESGDFTGIQQ